MFTNCSFDTTKNRLNCYRGISVNLVDMVWPTDPGSYVLSRRSYHQRWLMGPTLIVDDSELALVLSGTHLPTSKRWKAELAWRFEEVDLVLWDRRGFEPGSLTWQPSGLPTVLQPFVKYVKVCYICKKRFSTDNDKKYHKVRHHCHYTGKFRGAAHIICNLRYKTPKETPIVFHNSSTYDYHFIINKLAKEFDGQLECLGENTEKKIYYFFITN